MVEVHDAWMRRCSNRPPFPIDHHCAHFRFRQHVREFVAPEDEADVPSFEPAAVVAPIAEREDAFFDEAVVPYDSWFLDLAAWDPA